MRFEHIKNEIAQKQIVGFRDWDDDWSDSWSSDGWQDSYND